MAYTTSTDPFIVFRGTEEKIKDERTNPIVNGQVYFAYDNDKIFFDANGSRHEISGSGQVSFIKTDTVPTYDGALGLYVFPRTAIDAKKLEVDNIILTVAEADSALYRVVYIGPEEDDNGQPTGRTIVRAKQISGAGGGGGISSNPLTFTTIREFPIRTIDTEDVSITFKVNSIISTDEKCYLKVEINGTEITTLTDRYPLRTEITITIPHEYYSIAQSNEVKITATVDENVKVKTETFTAFHSEFSMPEFNTRAVYGTATGATQQFAINYLFSGLQNIKGHIRMLIDGEELLNLAEESNVAVNSYGGGAISGNGQLAIPCTIPAFQQVEHGNHTLTFNAFAVVNDTEYFVDSVSYDIIWATAEGASQPIIISNYTNTFEENYNIINIPYIVYAKDTENITVHLYVNGEELATSPITVQYDGNWKTWAISKYVPNIVNTFTIVAKVGNKTATKEFQVMITSGQLNLDPVNSELLLYLSALDRSNSESILSRQKWNYTSASSGVTTSAILNNFNWNNDGWQLDENGDNVLRLNNGASVEIPFTGLLQSDTLGVGFTIEVEFRCRNATSFAKLMTYESKSIQDTDEFGNLLWEQETVYEQDGVTPVMRVSTDTNGDPIQKTDTVGHLAFSAVIDGETVTLYEHEDGEGNKTYYNVDGELYADDNDEPIIPSQLTPIYAMEEVTRNKLRDPEGPDDSTNWIAIMVNDGAVEKKINYVEDPVTHVKSVANAVGTFFSSEVGLCIGTQEAFFASTGKKVNVRYADNDKVKISVVADGSNSLLYIYINSVLSGVERFGASDSFQAQGLTGFKFNSNYCDLDIYTLRVYNTPLNFDGIVQNWIGDAPNLIEKRKRYTENSITKTDSRNGYVTLDYTEVKRLSQAMADNYRQQTALGNHDAQKGLPIAVISTYPINLSDDTKSDLLPYNKAIKQYVDIRFWDPNGDVPSFKVQDFELSVQGTSSQGYPRRNYKAKFKATSAETNSYANKFPYYFTTWDGNDAKKDEWPQIPNTKNMTSEEAEAAIEAAWEAYANNTGGYTKLSAIDIGNGTEETKFCFKADYMDSSSAHNTSLADYINVMCIKAEDNTYNLIHPMKRRNPNAEYRQTVYGFPMLVFWDHKGQTTAPEFVGRYNFNTDKSATGSFGFTVDDEHSNMANATYISPKKKLKDGKWKTVKDDYDNLTPVIRQQGQQAEDVVDPETGDVLIPGSGDFAYKNPTYEEICECWELTSNQHGFTGFRRNDFDAVDNDNHLDFYNFWENRYHIMDFDPDAMYKADTTPNKRVARERLSLYAKNIIDLSRWIYSTDIHPWDTDDLTSINHHKLTQVINASMIKYDIDDNDRTAIHLKRDYYTVSLDGQTVSSPISENRFALVYTTDPQTEEETSVLKVYTDENKTTEMSFTLLYEDEINAKLDAPIFYLTRDSEIQAEWNEDILGTHKAYYSAPDEQHVIPDAFYHKQDILAYPKKEAGRDSEGNIIYVIDETKQPEVVGYKTVIRDTNDKTYDVSELYERYDYDTKDYRLSKYFAEFDQHLNFDYCAFYFILTEFLILYDSREKNMMIATWGPEQPGGNYIWYPIFYDMDTQLGINNSGTVYWDYDVNAQDDGLFSGAGSVLWDNFYTCFLDRIKAFYRAMRDKGKFNLENCIRYYNTESADRWTPIMKNVDAFYKYVAPSIDAPGLRYVTKQGTESITSSFFYCAQGDRTLNRAAFFRNRFNYKDSEWLGGSYRTQGGENIEMRYDANWTGTSDPNASDFSLPAGLSQQQQDNIKAQLEANATFDIKPYLTQYCSVYYDEIPREGGRFDIQQEPVVINGVPDEATKRKYPHNWETNIKKSGYITIDPLPAIQETINTGIALSQQLVYIYGPEYLRDLGDLSLKYLDRFFCQRAIRLNSLQIGNDNLYYKNTGMVSEAFTLDTAYYSSTTNGTKILNTNAKALLEYLDISNLSGLTGALDISGCLKIKTIKAIGTNYNTITLPEGNVVQSLYLPAATNTIIQIKCQRLNNIIRDKTRAISYLTNPPDVGLYIENFTDRMNITCSDDNNLLERYLAPGSEDSRKTAIAPNITASKNRYNAGAPYYTIMKKFQIESGVLGLASYEMLDYLVKQKIKMRYDDDLINDSSYPKDLLVRLLNVNWSPYEKIDSLYQDDRQNVDTQYFVRNDDLTYSQLPLDVSFEYANKNLGGIYRKTANVLSIDGGATDTVLEGIPNLDLLKMFIADFNNPTKVNNPGAGQSSYMIKDVYGGDTGSTTKYLPHIGGEIFLDNETAVDEYELYNIAKTYSDVLAVDDTPLTICARNVTPCPRAKFVVITMDGEQQSIAMYRSNDASAIVDIPDNPLRNDYDFRGWATEAAIQEYEPTFLQKNGSGAVTGTTHGIVEMDSTLLDHLAVTVDQDTGEFIFENDAEYLTFGNNPVIYYAVFTLHKYTVTYVLDSVLYANDPTNETAFENVLVPSNDYVDLYSPLHVPYYKNDSLPIGRMHKFIGWTTQGGIRTVNLHYQIRKDAVYYPLYEEVNAYANPLDASYFDYYDNINDVGSVQGGIVIYRINKKVGGRICIPKSIDGKPVVCIRNSAYNSSNKTWSRTVGGQDSGFTQQVYNGTQPVNNEFTAYDDLNGFSTNPDIEHIYFEGANNDTSSLNTVGQYAFSYMPNLSYVDFPNSLVRVESCGFYGDSKLSFNNLNSITIVGNNAFQNCNSNKEEFDNDIKEWTSGHISVLYISGETTISNGGFNGCGWSTVIIGSENDYSTKYYTQPIFASVPACWIYRSDVNKIMTDVLTEFDRLNGCVLVKLYSVYQTVQTINETDAGNKNNQIFSNNDRSSHGQYLDIQVYNP